MFKKLHHQEAGKRSEVVRVLVLLQCMNNKGFFLKFKYTDTHEITRKCILLKEQLNFTSVILHAPYMHFIVAYTTWILQAFMYMLRCCNPGVFRTQNGKMTKW